jgi:2-dehydropantoate 2-reductase
MRYIVYGADAVGSLLGGYLAHVGKSVVLVGRPAHVRQIQAAGLTMKNKFGTETITVEAVQVLGSVRPGADDLIFLCVKSQATAGALAELQSHYTSNPDEVRCHDPNAYPLNPPVCRYHRLPL